MFVRKTTNYSKTVLKKTTKRFPTCIEKEIFVLKLVGYVRRVFSFYA